MTDSPSAPKIDELLNTIEENCDPPNSKVDGFRIDCLSLVQHKLSGLSEQALKLAIDFKAGRTRIESVAEALIECHRKVQELGTAEAASRQRAGLRAAIFLLDGLKHPDTKDIVDSVSSFLRFVNSLEEHTADQVRLLRKHFAECL